MKIKHLFFFAYFLLLTTTSHAQVPEFAKEHEALINKKFLTTPTAEEVKAHMNALQRVYQQQIEATAIGQTIPDFLICNSNGDTVNFYSLRTKKTKYIALDIWATWCGPCLEEAPIVDSLRNVYKKKKVLFYKISMDKNPEKWFNFLKKNDTQWHYLAGESPYSPISWLNAYLYDKDAEYPLATGIPRYVILDKNFKVIHRETRIEDQTFQKALEGL
jgi:thiol-disulfide isomerase/thioredoxin